jgi:hypothetical protein
MFKEQYHTFYGELYHFHEKHAAAETMDDWAALAREAGAFTKKYPTAFAAAMIAAVVDEIELNFKQRK